MATKTTMMVMMMVVAIMASSMTSQQLWHYCPISAPNGTRLCAAGWPTSPSQTFDTNKATRCALISMSSHATIFNYKYNSTHGQCTLYETPPWSYQPEDNCLAFELQSNPVTGSLWPSVTVVDCSLPFTFKGRLYEQCVQTVRDLRGTCNKFACVLPGRVWAHCLPPTDNKLNKSMVNVTVTVGSPFSPPKTYQIPAVGNWLVVQQRLDSNVGFNQQWFNYKHGFGEVGVNRSFWLGLDPLHQLTSNGGYTRMRVEMYADGNAWYSAEYDQFSVGNETTGYQLSISGYSGDAGDEMFVNNGQSFSTYDQGNYMAVMMQGGWWYSDFDNSCLNGAYNITSMYSQETGFYWNSFYSTRPPPLSSLVGVKPGRLLISRIMISRDAV